MIMQTKATLDINFKLWSAAGTPPWWREAGESGTKKLYQPEPRPVVYVVPITSTLGRLPLIPAGDHGTIPAAMRHRKKELFEYGKCDESALRHALAQAASCTTSTRVLALRPRQEAPDWLRFKFTPSLHHVCTRTRIKFASISSHVYTLARIRFVLSLHHVLQIVIIYILR